MLNPLFNITPLLADIEAGATILTPNNRLASKVLDAWGLYQLQQGHNVWHSPAVYAIDNWIEQCWQQLVMSASPGCDRVCLNSAQELSLWEQVIESDTQKPPLLNTSGLSHSARNATQTLAQWCVDDEELSRHSTSGTELLQRWQKLFNSRQKQLNAITSSEKNQRVIAAFSAQQLPLVNRIITVEFQTLTPQQQHLLNVASKQWSPLAIAPPTTVNQTRVALRDSTDEVQQAAQWARQQLEQNRQQRIGVIIPDLPSRRQQVERIFREVIEPEYNHPDIPRYTAPFNVSTATPLASTAMAGSALQLLALNRYRQPLANYCQVLNSPFWGNGNDDQAVRSLAEVRLRILAVSQPSAVAFREACNKAVEAFKLNNRDKASTEIEKPATGAGNIENTESIASCLTRFENLRRNAPARATHRQWQCLFSEQLLQLGWPGPRPLDSVEHQQLEHWQQLMEQFAALSMVSPAIDLTTALNQLTQLAQNTPFQAQTEDSPLQILGLLEGAGLRFDQLWLMGMDDRQWPATPEPNPLLPLDLQRQYNMPRASAERELELAHKLLHGYQQQAPVQIFSHCQFDGDAELAVSQLIVDIPTASLDFINNNHQSEIPCALELNRIDNAPALDIEQEVIRGGSGILKDQANCPFNAFARWRLGAQQASEPVSGLSASERGDILHNVLDLLWGELQNRQTLLECSEQQLNDHISSINQRVLLQWQQRKPNLGQRFFDIESERLTALIQQWLEVEQQRPDFQVAAREAKIDVNFAELPLTLRIDRIDTSAQGETLLVDYKTGNSTIAGWLGERPSEPQLPLYAALHREIQQPLPSAVSFAVINAETRKFVAVTENPSLIPGYRLSSHHKDKLPEHWPDLIAQWRTTLTDITRSYLDGGADITVYNSTAFNYQSELLPLNRWLEREQLERYANQHSGNEVTP